VDLGERKMSGMGCVKICWMEKICSKGAAF